MEVSGRYDDAMDAFGMHGVRGIVGGILTGFFANDYVSDERGVFYGRGGCAARHPDLRHRRGRGLVVPYFLYHFDRFVEDHGRARVRYLQTLLATAPCRVRAASGMVFEPNPSFCHITGSEVRCV